MSDHQASAPGHAIDGPSESDQQAVHEEIARKLKEHPAKKGMRFNVVVTILEIGGALALFHLARGMGASDVVSYLAGSAGPVAGGLAVWARAKKFSGASAAIFAFTAVSAIIAVAGSTTPKILLYKDCAATALVGSIFLGSCLFARKPIVFYMAQRYGTDGTHEGMANFDAMWDTYGDFRTGMSLTSYLWATVFLVQAAGTALIVRRATYSTAYDYDQILPLVAVAVGIVGSMVIGRHFAKRGRARATAAAVAQRDAP